MLFNGQSLLDTILWSESSTDLVTRTTLPEFALNTQVETLNQQVPEALANFWEGICSNGQFVVHWPMASSTAVSSTEEAFSLKTFQ